MNSEVKSKRTFAAGRAGELTSYANPLTFSMLEEVFGYEGPYRRTLYGFGIGNLQEKSSYLTSIKGHVYSDIEVENSVLWKSISHKLIPQKEKVDLKFSLYGGIGGVSGFVKKTINDAKIINSVLEYTEEAQYRYSDFSLALEGHFQHGILSVKDFLEMYEDVVFISYLYELIFSYNNHKSIVPKNEAVRDYVQKNDFLIGTKDHFIEKKVSYQFVLGNSRKKTVKPDKPVFIPHLLSDPLFKMSHTVKAEVILQCLKNNLRLKTSLLLSLLNDTLRLQAEKIGVKEYGFLTLSELIDFDNYSREYIFELVDQRRAEHDSIVSLPPIIYENDLGSIDSVESATIYRGTSCSPGVVSGRFQYVEDADTAISGEIIMFPNASPAFSSKYKKAKGLIFKVGSPLSHGAIVAREMGVPAIVLPEDLVFLEGKNVELSGSEGTVRALL